MPGPIKAFTWGLAASWPVDDSAPLAQTTLMGLIGLVWILWKTNSEMEICKQEIYWVIPLGSTLQRTKRVGLSRKRTWTKGSHKQRPHLTPWELITYEGSWVLRGGPTPRPVSSSHLCSFSWSWCDQSEVALLLRAISGKGFSWEPLMLPAAGEIGGSAVRCPALLGILEQGWGGECVEGWEMGRM